MSAGIETKIEGNPVAVDTTATWLRSSLRSGLADSGEHVVSARRLADRGWEGHASHAYRDYASDIIKVTDEHEERVGRAAGKLDAYSDKLTQVQNRMSELRAEATAGGLTVSGTLIVEPPTAVPPAVPTGEVTPAQIDSYDAAVGTYEKAAAKVTLYNRLIDDVDGEARTFVDWVDANLTPVAAALGAPLVDKMVDFLKDNVGNLAISTALTGSERALKDKVKGLRTQASDLRRARRSGNPARRALGNHPDTPARIRDLRSKADWFGKGGKLLGPLGGVIEVWNGLESESPGGGLIAAGLGIGAGALIIATAPVSVPAVVVVAGAVAVGAGVTWVATEGWDALPDDFTEPVDDWVEDQWDGVKDAASDGWEAVKGWF
jgi:hypothetical protein